MKNSLIIAILFFLLVPSFTAMTQERSIPECTDEERVRDQKCSICEMKLALYYKGLSEIQEVTINKQNDIISEAQVEINRIDRNLTVVRNELEKMDRRLRIYRTTTIIFGAASIGLLAAVVF